MNINVVTAQTVEVRDRNIPEILALDKQLSDVPYRYFVRYVVRSLSIHRTSILNPRAPDRACGVYSVALILPSG